jgi:lipid II:glycine glycyltransferase (peptidoglycan interpeptide bridge formation enzyme)
MKVIELTIKDFDEFAANHALRNYSQSSKYAKIMGEKGFTYDYIGYIDDSNNLVAASLILIKKIGAFYKFAYAPRGFLIDYYNNELLRMFVRDISEYYKGKGLAFIKINPEIIIGELNVKKNFMPVYNQNVNIIDALKDLGFKRRRELTPLDFIVPRINPYINLKSYDYKKLDSEYKDKIKNASKRGLSIELATNKDIGILYDFIKNETYENINFYRNILNTFNNGESELLLVKVDHETSLINAQKVYEKELDENNYWNEVIQKDNNEKNLAEKMNSDKKLLKCKEEMVIATDNLRKNKYQYLGGAITVKYKNRVSVVACGFDNKDEFLEPSYYLYSSLIERYKDNFDFLDLNGLASNFNPESEYYSFNEKKLAFNPTIYEFIGEFDLVLNENAFKRIQSKGLLSKEFYPSHKVK